MEKIFALYDSDLFYATRFMDYFQKKKNFEFQFSTFTQKDSLLEFLQLQQVEILLLGEDNTLAELPLDKIKFIYQFRSSIGKDKVEEHPCIFKYQTAQAVINDILNDYRKKGLNTKEYSSSKTTQILSIFAPVTGIGKLAFAWSVSSLISEQNKVLFILLDPLPVQLLTNFNISNQSLTEFIYYLKESPDILIKMNALLSVQGNLSVLAGIAHGADIHSLTREDMRKWTSELRNSSGFQTVVFFLGSDTDAAAEVMNTSDIVLISTNGNQYENLVQKELERQLKQSGSFNQDKFNYVELPEEAEFEKLPVTITELSFSTYWSAARQYLNY